MRIGARVRSSPGEHDVVVRTDGRETALPLPAKGYAQGGSAVNGGELLTLAIATCYANDLFREAKAMAIAIESVDVDVEATFGGPGEPGRDIRCRAAVHADVAPERIDALLRRTDAVAEVHNTLRVGTPVALEPSPAAAAATAAANPPAFGPVDPADVQLREIGADTLRAVLALRVAPAQRGFVADNATSIAQAHFHPEAWFRAICVGDQPVGFVMLSDPTLRPRGAGARDEGTDVDCLHVWRFMVDARHQGRGIGRAAMQRVLEHARARGTFRRVALSYVPGPGAPEPFYRSLGFVATGEEDEGELVMEQTIVAT